MDETEKTVTDPSIVMEQPQLPSPSIATFGSDSAIAEEGGGGGDVGLSMEGGEVGASWRWPIGVRESKQAKK